MKEDAPSSFLFFVFWPFLLFFSVWTELPPAFSSTEAQSSSKCEGTEKAIGVDLGVGTRHWLGFLCTDF